MLRAAPPGPAALALVLLLPTLAAGTLGGAPPGAIPEPGTLAAAGRNEFGGSLCLSPRYLALAGASDGGPWHMRLAMAVVPPLDGCALLYRYEFAGPWDPAAGGCLPEVAPGAQPRQLCLSAAPVPAGTLVVRVCFAGPSPCRPGSTLFGGALTAAAAASPA